MATTDQATNATTDQATAATSGPSDPPVFPPPSADDVARIKAQNRKVITYTAAGHTILCKPIPRVTWKRVQAIQADDDSEENIADVVMADTLLYPSTAQLEALLEDFPAAPEAIVLDLITVAKGEAMKRGKRVLPRSSVRDHQAGSGSQVPRSTRSFAVKTRTSRRSARS